MRASKAPSQRRDVTLTSLSASAADTGSFDTTVKPVLTKSCYPCHNDRLASGSLNLQQFSTPASIEPGRDQWERVIQKMRTGEMPPKGMPKPSLDTVNAFIATVRQEFERIDRAAGPLEGKPRRHQRGARQMRPERIHALDLGIEKLAILARLAWLEGRARHESLWRREKLARVWIFSERQTLWRGDDAVPEEDGGMTAYAWFVFERHHSGQLGVSKDWGDHAALANDGRGWEIGSNSWPNPEPSVPL